MCLHPHPNHPDSTLSPSLLDPEKKKNYIYSGNNCYTQTSDKYVFCPKVLNQEGKILVALQETQHSQFVTMFFHKHF